jgi:hypothetical protein
MEKNGGVLSVDAATKKRFTYDDEIFCTKCIHNVGYKRTTNPLQASHFIGVHP